MVLEVTDDAVIVRADDVQPKEYVPLTAQTPLDCIRQAGIVGLGGAGFPTYQKLAVPFLNGGVVIANASECEPVLTHNIKAIERDCRPMIRGLQLAMDLVHADKGVIAIKAIHGDAVRALQQAIAADDRLALHFLPNVYPVGEERAVVREVLGTLLDAGSLPSKAGAVIINVETLQRVAEAVDDKKPLIDKDVTVAGKLNGPEVQVFHDLPLGMAVTSWKRPAAWAKNMASSSWAGLSWAGGRAWTHPSSRRQAASSRQKRSCQGLKKSAFSSVPAAPMKSASGK